MPQNFKPATVGISGGSASGKTTLASSPRQGTQRILARDSTPRLLLQGLVGISTGRTREGLSLRTIRMQFDGTHCWGISVN